MKQIEKITLKNGKTLIIAETLYGWSVTNEENYYTFIQNAREVMKFSSNDFKSIDEVKEYLKNL